MKKAMSLRRADNRAVDFVVAAVENAGFSISELTVEETGNAEPSVTLRFSQPWFYDKEAEEKKLDDLVRMVEAKEEKNLTDPEPKRQKEETFLDGSKLVE